VIVHNLHVRRAFFRPAEANAKLTVDADAVLALALSLQRLQMIAGWGAQKLQSMCCIKLRQLPNCDIRDAGKPLGSSGLKQRLRVGATEAINHESRL